MKSKITYITATFLLIFSLQSFAQEFVVKNFKEVPTDISAREHEVLDINDEPCALVKIYTGLEYVRIDGNRGVEKVETKESVIWVWVPGGTRQLKISKDGMVMLPYILPTGLKASTVYSFNLTTDQLVTATISTPNIDAEVELDGKVYKTNQPIPDLPEGKFNIRVFKLGYATINETIEVSMKNNFFSYDLKRTEQAKLTINSDPSGCVLFVNGNNVGTTNHTGFYFPGDYKINISKVNYLTVDTVITFNPEVNSVFNFKIEKNTALVKLNVDQQNAVVMLDGKEVLSEKYLELNAGVSHEIEIRKEDYRTYTEAFEVSRNDTIIKNIKLEKQKGQLSFIVEPESANVVLTHEEGEKFNWQGSKNMELPVGEYSLEISQPGFFPVDSVIVIKDQQKEFINRSLIYKNISSIKAGALSVVPGLGQYYSQRKTAGTVYLASTLALAGATGFFYMQANNLGNDYMDAKTAYEDENEINRIAEKRTTMDNTYNDYISVARQRDIFIGLTAGLYLWNIVDAVIFAKKHDSSDPSKVGQNIDFNIIADPISKSTGFALTYKF